MKMEDAHFKMEHVDIKQSKEITQTLIGTLFLVEVTDHRSTTIQLKNQLVTCCFTSINNESKISFSFDVAESLTATLSLIANRRIKREKTQKYNSCQVLGDRLLYSLSSISEAMGIGDK